MLTEAYYNVHLCYKPDIMIIKTCYNSTYEGMSRCLQKRVIMVVDACHSLLKAVIVLEACYF